MPSPYLPPLEIFSLWDKEQHALGYGTLTLSALLAYPSAHKLRLAALLLAHGVLIEALQHLLGHRVGEWQDAAADALGVLLALGVARLVGPLRAPQGGSE
jgi:VanZ family protein